jgi:hypothetical protein
MTRLNVQAAARWASIGLPGGAETFQEAPMLLAVSVTDADGARVELTQDQLRVGYQYAPEHSEDSVAVISYFHPNGPTQGDTRWFSCRVHPTPSDSWGADEVFLCVTVRRPNPGGSGVDRGAALIPARYRQRVPQIQEIQEGLGPLKTAVEHITNDVAHLIAKVDNARELILTVHHDAARLPNGIITGSALQSIMQTLEEIKDEV